MILKHRNPRQFWATSTWTPPWKCPKVSSKWKIWTSWNPKPYTWWNTKHVKIRVSIATFIPGKQTQATQETSSEDSIPNDSLYSHQPVHDYLLYYLWHLSFWTITINICFINLCWYICVILFSFIKWM